MRCCVEIRGSIIATAIDRSLRCHNGGSRLDDVIKSGRLRVCTPGDYKPFSYLRPEGGYEGLDIDLVQSAAKALGVEVVMVKSAWPTLMKDFLEKCDVAVGGSRSSPADGCADVERGLFGRS